MLAASAIDSFIHGAPDARPPTLGVNCTVPRQMKRKISIDIDPSLLQRLDDFARASGISRNAALAMAAARLLNERK